MIYSFKNNELTRNFPRNRMPIIGPAPQCALNYDPRVSYRIFDQFHISLFLFDLGSQKLVLPSRPVGILKILMTTDLYTRRKITTV